jgi:cell division protein FtsW
MDQSVVITLGFMNFQPSELMKFVAVLLAAHYTIRRQEHLHSLVKGFLPLGIIVGIVGGLLLWEPDTGRFHGSGCYCHGHFIY